MANTGRPAIFIPKDGNKGYRVLALTKTGQRLFEQARAKLKKLAKWKGTVSDADTVEMLVRGDDETMAHLRNREETRK